LNGNELSNWSPMLCNDNPFGREIVENREGLLFEFTSVDVFHSTNVLLVNIIAQSDLLAAYFLRIGHKILETNFSDGIY
jgi:hypothetical protein